MNNSGTPEGELSVSTRRGSPNLPDHPKELPQPPSSQRRGGRDPHSKSPRSGWRCGLSTTQHQQTRPSHQGHAGPRSLFWAGYGGPHPPPTQKLGGQSPRPDGPSKSVNRSNLATLRETLKVTPESAVSSRGHSITGSFSWGVLSWMNC